MAAIREPGKVSKEIFLWQCKKKGFQKCFWLNHFLADGPNSMVLRMPSPVKAYLYVFLKISYQKADLA